MIFAAKESTLTFHNFSTCNATNGHMRCSSSCVIAESYGGGHHEVWRWSDGDRDVEDDEYKEKRVSTVKQLSLSSFDTDAVLPKVALFCPTL